VRRSTKDTGQRNNQKSHKTHLEQIRGPNKIMSKIKKYKFKNIIARKIDLTYASRSHDYIIL